KRTDESVTSKKDKRVKRKNSRNNRKIVHMKRTKLIGILLGWSVAVTAIASQSGSQLTVVAQGLNNPRGLAFAPNGALYVAEAGLGAGDGNGGFAVGLGFTASLTEIIGATSPNPRARRIVTGLVSVGDTENGF